MTIKWTPGPWRTDPECGDESVLGPDGFLVADCAIFSSRSDFSRSDDSAAGNARLISAAPELYEMLQRLAVLAGGPAAAEFKNELAGYASLRAWRDALRGARAALAKAAGDSNQAVAEVEV